MANLEALNDEALATATGGASTGAKNEINTTDWQGAHWQPQQYPMGTTFTAHGFLWYRINVGDTLSQIAVTFKTTTATLKANNPATIQDINKIYAGDAIIIRRA